MSTAAAQQQSGDCRCHVSASGCGSLLQDSLSGRRIYKCFSCSNAQQHVQGPKGKAPAIVAVMGWETLTISDALQGLVLRLLDCFAARRTRRTRRQ